MEEAGQVFTMHGGSWTGERGTEGEGEQTAAARLAQQLRSRGIV